MIIQSNILCQTARLRPRTWRIMLLLPCLMGIVDVLPQNGGPENTPDTVPPFENILKIDIHVHMFDDLPEFVSMLHRTNTRVVNICVGGNQPELLVPCERRAELLQKQYGPSFSFASTFDRTKREEPDYARQVSAWLDETFQAGACMVKIWKDVGMELMTSKGAYLMPDDTVLDPVYEHLAKRNKPVMAHLADPIDAWLPLDPESPHYGYYSENPEWHLHGKAGFPSHAEILAARERVLVKHPGLVMIAAHLGSEAHDLDKLAERFDRFPNLFADVAARTFELRRLPVDKVRRFFIRYQDRLLYGTDAEHYTEGRLPAQQERVDFAAAMEKAYRGDYDYYAGRGAGVPGDQQADCLRLPRGVLKKFYHENARRLMPELAAPALKK